MNGCGPPSPIGARGAGERDEDAYRAAWDRLEGAFFARVLAAAEPFEDWRDRFRAAARETVRLVDAHPAQARFLIVDALAAGEVGRRRQRQLGSRIARRIDSARGELADPDAIPAATAPWIVAMFFDRVYRRCAADGGPPLAAQLPELMFLAISAYFGTEAGLEELLPA